MVMAPALRRSLEVAYALVFVRMTFSASAPAPEIVRLPRKLRLAAALAANAVAVMVALSVAVMVMSPVVASTPQSVVFAVAPSALVIQA